MTGILSTIPWINFTLLVVLAIVAHVAHFLAVHKRAGTKSHRRLLSFLSWDFTYVAVFIFFRSARPEALPEESWYLDVVWGRIAYWAIYSSLIVAFIGYIGDLWKSGSGMDEEVRAIVKKTL